MKFSPFLILIPAGLALAWVVLHTEGPDSSMIPVRDERAPVPVDLSGPVPAGSRLHQFDVEGMCCEGCTRKLHDALLAVPGVSDAAVRFVGGTALAVAPVEMPAEELRRALEFDKYTAVRHE